MAHEPFTFEGIINASYSEAAPGQSAGNDQENLGHLVLRESEVVSERLIRSYSGHDHGRYPKQFENFVIHSCVEISDEFEPDPEWTPLFIKNTQEIEE